MKVKTFKRMSKRFISTLLSVLMVISLFTVCMVGSITTASAATVSLPSGTIYFDATNTGWTNVSLYVGHSTEAGLAGVHTIRYDLKKVKDNIWSCEFYGYDEAHYYFFSNNSSYAATGAGTAIDINTVRSGVGNNRTKEISSATADGTLYTASGSAPYSVNTKSDYEPYPFVKTGEYYINTQLYNYRNAQQVQDAVSNPGKQAYEIDTKNGNSEKMYHLTQYAAYNAKVSEWYKNAEQNTTHKSIPLYQGNFHDVFSNKGVGNNLYDNSSWVSSVNANQWVPRSSEVSSDRVNVNMAYDGDNWNVLRNLYRFDTLANAANRTTAANAGNSAAVGLVDAKLNSNNTLTQNGIEIPQFSDEFIKNNPTLTSKYENLKFEVLKGKKEGSNNIWYRYNSAVDGNRTLKKGTNLISYDKPQQGSWPGLNPTSTGYYPFNAGGTHDGTYPRYENVVNCTGTRFDIEFATKKEWNETTKKYDYTYNGEDLMFTFTGDDDLWVYVDGYLALDLGGSHNKADGKINLSQMYYEITTGAYDVKMKTKTSDNNEYYDSKALNEDYNGIHALNPELVKSLHDTTKSHTLTVFYLERGLYDSNLSFEFMLPQTDTLTVKQEIKTDTVNQGLLAETFKTANNDAFEVVLETNSAEASSNDTAALPISENFVRANYDGSTTMLQATEPTTSAESPTGVAFKNETGGMTTAGGTTFVWNDTNKSSDQTKSSTGTGTGIVDNDGGINLLYNQSAKFNDQFQTGSKMYLTAQDKLQSFDTTEATTNPPNTSSTDRTVSKYYNQTYVIKDNINNIINQDTDGAFYFQRNDGTRDIVKLTATYTNEVKTGTVKFTKKLDAGETDDGTEFTFEVLFSNVFGGTDNEFKEYNIDYTVLDKNGNKISSGTGSEIKLNVGETAVITGVPIGTRYRITETGDNNNDKNYTVSGITTNSSTTTGSVEGKEVSSSINDETVISNNVLVGTVNNATNSNDDSISHFDFNNTTGKTKIVYRFHDRLVTTGLPTSMETHYTYFTGEFNGKLVVDGDTSTETINRYKNTIINNAPDIKNVKTAYNLIADNIKFNYKIQASDLADAEGIGNISVGETVILATYTELDRKYTVELNYVDDTGKNVTTTVTKGFNELASTGEIKTPGKYTDASGTNHVFKYWAKLVDDGEGGTKYTPVSTNFSYSYRVSDNMKLVAVYDTAIYGELEAPIANYPYDYLATGEGTGFDASSAERIYDSYTLDVTNPKTSVTTKQDRTRINVVFGSVGSKDMDENIKSVGYILIKNDGSYVTARNFSDKKLLEQLEAIANGTPSSNGVYDIYTDDRSASYKSMVNFYNVEKNIDYIDGWESHYDAGSVTLTNKNRVNIVFDKKNTPEAQNTYYTCYTVMVREDYKYNDDGSVVKDSDDKPVRQKYYYVSGTPAYFNLGEAEPMISPTPSSKSYSVVTSVVDQDGKDATNAGTLTTSATSNTVKNGEKLTLTVKPTSYIAADGIMVSTLTSVNIGNVVVPADKFKTGQNGELTYTFNFNDEVHLATKGATTLNITANFNVVKETNLVIVDSSTVNANCTNGSVQVSADGNTYGSTAVVKKGNKFYAKAVPEAGYDITAWSTGATTDVIEVTVNSDGTYTIPTPTFNQYVTFTVRASNSTMGSVTVANAKNLGNNTYKAVKDSTVTITATPGADYSFTNWTGTGTPITDATTTITPIEGADYVANFVSRYITFTVRASDSTMGTVSVTGATSLGNNQYKVDRGSKVTIKANAAGNYAFVNWTSVGATITDATADSIEITPVDTAVYIANFELTSKRVRFKVSITNSWAETDNPDFYLTYNDPNGNKATVKLEKISSNNYYSPLVAIDENTSNWTLYLLRCKAGYVPTNGTTTAITGSIHNVATTNIKKEWIAGATDGGNYDISFTFS